MEGNSRFELKVSDNKNIIFLKNNNNNNNLFLDKFTAPLRFSGFQIKNLSKTCHLNLFSGKSMKNTQIKASFPRMCYT